MKLFRNIAPVMTGAIAVTAALPLAAMAGTFPDLGRRDIGRAFGTGATTAPTYQARKIKHSAIVAPDQLPNYPEISNIAEAGGLANFELRVWRGLFASRGTPPNVINIVIADTADALGEPDTQEWRTCPGIRVWPGHADALKIVVVADAMKFKIVVKPVNI